MNTAGYILSSGVSGMISGAIGAAVADSSDSSPVLKGGFVTGAISALMATIIVALSPEELPATPTSQTGISGMQSEWSIR